MTMIESVRLTQNNPTSLAIFNLTRVIWCAILAGIALRQ